MKSALSSFLLALVVAMAAGLGVLHMAAPQHTLLAEFTNADGLVTGEDVTVAGVAVGSVTSLTILPASGDGLPLAVATLSIDRSQYWPLHRGTRATVTELGVLSDVDVALTPGGQAAPPLPNGATLTAAETVSPVTLNQVTDVLTPQVTAAIDVQIDQGAVALANGGAAGLSGTLTNLPPLLDDLEPLSNVLATDTPQLSDLNSEMDQVTAQLADEDAALNSLITRADTTMTAIASRESDLTGTLSNAAATLTDLNTALAGEQPDLAAIFREGPEAVELTEQDMTDLLPLIQAINPHVANLDQLLVELRTATGYTTGTPGGIDTLRLDGFLPPVTDSSSACGGDPSQQPASCSSSGGGQ